MSTLIPAWPRWNVFIWHDITSWLFLSIWMYAYISYWRWCGWSLNPCRKVHWGEMSGGGGGREVPHSGCSTFGSEPPLQASLLQSYLRLPVFAPQANPMGGDREISKRERFIKKKTTKWFNRTHKKTELKLIILWWVVDSVRNCFFHIYFLVIMRWRSTVDSLSLI